MSNPPSARSEKQARDAHDVPHANSGDAEGAAPGDGAAAAGADKPAGAGGVRSYALLQRDTMSLYMNFYKHTYGKSTIDRRTKEFVAIAASLASGCKNCLEGHVKKAIQHGATRAEISEVIAITLGVAAATIVDRSDIAAANIGLDIENWALPHEGEGDGPSAPAS